jgi:hypothetical protein
VQLRTYTVRFCTVIGTPWRGMQKRTGAQRQQRRVRSAAMTFGTYTVRNVNSSARQHARLTKCTAEPSPLPKCRS